MKTSAPAGVVLRDPVHFLAFGFGAGLAPVAPGTFGTVVGLPLAWWVSGAPLWPAVAVITALSLFGIWLCGESARRLGVHDHSGIVWDEICGLAVVALVCPQDPLWLAAAFGLFRLFDIAKPWPIRYVDHSLHGGLGIMLDDILAGAFGAAGLYCLSRLLSSIG